MLPTLDAARIRLRPLGPTDAEDLFAVMGDPAAMRHWDGPPVPDLADMQRRLAWMAEQDPARFAAWAIVRPDADRAIGAMFYHHREIRHGRLEVGYILRPDHWGQGLMAEALGRLLDHCFDDLAANRVEACIEPGNAASIKLIERLGFRREGLMRAKILYGPGDPRDAWLYGLLAADRR